jgi:acetolactate synthase-1/2/3 large subunit
MEAEADLVLAQDAMATMLALSGATHFFHVPVFGRRAMKRLISLGVTPIATHGEKAAAYMADGYSRVSGEPGLCGAQAIGGTNLAAGLRDAWMARSPVIAFTGGADPAVRHRNLYQDHDDMQVFESLTKFNASAGRGETLPELIRHAYRSATTGVPRPVHLEFVGDSGDKTNASVDPADVAVDMRYLAAPAIRTLADEESVRSAAESLNASERPLVLVGGGVKRSRAEDTFIEFIKKHRLPVVSSLNGLGVMSEDDPLWAGVVGGYARETANALAAEADIVLVVGSSLGSLTTRGVTIPPRSTRMIHIDIDPAEIGRSYRWSQPLVGDAQAVLQQLNAAVDTLERPDWHQRVRAQRAMWRNAADEVELQEASPMRPERMWRALSDALPDDCILVGDTGHVGAWSARHLHLRSSQLFIRAAGSLGWAFPAAIGAKCAAPGRPVICLTGDAGFYYHLAELETARRYGIALVVVVNNNGGMNQEAELWTAGTPEEKNWRFEPADFAAIGEAFSCPGFVVESADQMDAALKKALGSGSPAVIDARTDSAVAAPTVYTETHASS